MIVRQVTMSPEAMSQSLYGNNSAFMSGYLTDQMTAMGSAGGNVSTYLMSAAQRNYDFFNDMTIQYGVQSELEDLGMTVVDNYIVPLTTFEGLQSANITMQRFIMAHPDIRGLYLDQNLDGYSDTYQPVDYGYEYGVGWDDPNYRMAMDGMIVCNYEDNTYEITSLIGEEYAEGDRARTVDEQFSIKETYDYIDFIMQQSKQDFTSVVVDPGNMNR